MMFSCKNRQQKISWRDQSRVENACHSRVARDKRIKDRFLGFQTSIYSKMLVELKEAIHNRLLSKTYWCKLKLSLGSTSMGHKPFRTSIASISSDVPITILTRILTKGDMQAVTSATVIKKPFPFRWWARMWGITKKTKPRETRSIQVIWQPKFIKPKPTLTTSKMKTNSWGANWINSPNSLLEWKPKNNRL